MRGDARGVRLRGASGAEWREEQRQQERERPELDAQPEEPRQNPYTVPEDPKELARASQRFLGFVPEGRTLVIVLDALD
ncbi:MAG: hypothetical protein AB7Y46_20780 [Armatimonadota bacterium]